MNRNFLFKISCYALEKLAPFISDKVFLKLKFKVMMGYPLNLDNPATFSEKLQWLKLYNRKPEYTQMVDKFEAKKYVGNIIGKEYIIPTLGIYNTIEEIDYKNLPNQFVIKTTHDSGSVVICKDKSVFDCSMANLKLSNALKNNFYYQNREWPYKNVVPRIIAEEYMEDGGASQSLDDYKVMCFNGRARLIELHTGRNTPNYSQDFYDTDWNKSSITQGTHAQTSDKNATRPALLEKMIELSELLARDIPHVRVDWYIVNNHLYFGELTFFDGSGFEPWDRYEDDLMMGSWITLPNKNQEAKSPDRGFGNQGIDMFY